YKSSLCSLYPGEFSNGLLKVLVFLLNLLLPVEKRYVVENMILIGLIWSSTKPTYGIQLIPIMKSIKKHFDDGCKITGNTTIRGLICQILTDMGQRYGLLNMHSANSQCACHLCCCIGESVNS